MVSSQISISCPRYYLCYVKSCLICDITVHYPLNVLFKLICSSRLLGTLFIHGSFAFNEILQYFNLNQYCVSNYLLMWQVAI